MNYYLALSIEIAYKVSNWSFLRSLGKNVGSLLHPGGGNVTSFFQVLEMRAPIHVIGERVYQNQIPLFVQHFQLLYKSTGLGQVMNVPP